MAASTSTPPPVYRKLTRLYRSLGMMSQCWLGPDHLLHVVSTGYTETYRRCYFRDIQSILIVHTGRRTYLALFLIVVLLIAFGSVMAADGGPWAYAIVGVIPVGLLLWNHWLGEGCRVVVVTAVQQEKIPSFSRLPRTRRKLAEVRELIEAAQADLLTPAVARDVPAATEALPVTAPEPPVVAVPLPMTPPPLPPPLPSP